MKKCFLPFIPQQFASTNNALKTQQFFKIHFKLYVILWVVQKRSLFLLLPCNNLLLPCNNNCNNNYSCSDNKQFTSSQASFCYLLKLMTQKNKNKAKILCPKDLSVLENLKKQFYLRLLESIDTGVLQQMLNNTFPCKTFHHINNYTIFKNLFLENIHHTRSLSKLLLYK